MRNAKFWNHDAEQGCDGQASSRLLGSTMNNFLIGMAVFVITVLAALFAVPYVVDWNNYRGVFEEEATRMLGREVRVGGAVNLHLLPTPYFSLERVRIGDASDGLPEPFFRAESLAVKLAVPPLLRGAVEANEVELKRPVLRLSVDDKGHWNWQSFVSRFKYAASVPTNVALSSVVVKNGTVILHGTDGLERTTFEDVQAELSSPALSGPYRVRAAWGGKEAGRELRLATAQPDPDGGVRFKAVLRHIESASSFTLDGRVDDLMSAPQVAGELTARLPFAGLWPNETRPINDEAFDLKAQLRADVDRLQLSSLSLAFEQDGKPQIVTGEALVRWRKGLEVETTLASRWLDLDRIAGAPEASGPLASLLPVALRIRDLMPADGRSRAVLNVEQANAGHDTVAGLELSLSRSGGQLIIEHFRSAMPGGSHVELKGTLTGASGRGAFLGSIDLRGTSLPRFAGWVTGGAVSAEGKAEGSFGLRAGLAADNGRVAFRDLVGDISGTTVNGSATYQWAGTRELGLRIEGPQLDARTLIPAGANLADLVGLLLPGVERRSDTSQGDLTGADLAIRISTGKLLTAGANYRDVNIEIERRGHTVRIPRLRLTGDEGFLLDLEGEVVETAGRPKGILRVFANADTPPALRPLAELVAIPEHVRPDGTRFQALAPLRLAGTVSFGQRTTTSLDIEAEGEANGGAVHIASRFDGASKGWRYGPADVTVSVSNPAASKVAALLLPSTGNVIAEGSAPNSGQAGRVLLRAGGVPAQGMPILFSLTANDTGVAFSGSFTALPEAPRLSGNVELANADGARIAALAQLAPPLRLASFPLSGTLHMTTDGSTINVGRFALSLGATRLRGRLGIATENDKRRVNAHVEADEIGVAQLLAPFLDLRLGSATSVAEAALAERGSIWPPQPFDANGLEGLLGDVAIDVKRLALTGDASLSDVRLRARMGNGKAVVQELSGKGLDGTWNAALELARIPGGAELKGSLKVDDVDLGRLSRSATGRASATLTFAGRGASPRAVMAVLQGDGQVVFKEAAIPVAPAAIASAVEASLAAPPERLAMRLREALLENLGKPPLPLPQSLALELADGFLRSKPIAVETSEGSTSGSMQLDVGAFLASADWRLLDKTLRKGDRALPAVTVHYRGPVAALARMTPQLGSEALEREVTVRKMERDVDELERLRRLDETRRREEAERQREQTERLEKLQAQQQQQPATSATPSPPPAPAPTPRPQAQPKPKPNSLLPSWFQ